MDPIPEPPGELHRCTPEKCENERMGYALCNPKQKARCMSNSRIEHLVDRLEKAGIHYYDLVDLVWINIEHSIDERVTKTCAVFVEAHLRNKTVISKIL